MTYTYECRVCSDYVNYTDDDNNFNNSAAKCFEHKLCKSCFDWMVGNIYRMSEFEVSRELVVELRILGQILSNRG